MLFIFIAQVQTEFTSSLYFTRMQSCTVQYSECVYMHGKEVRDLVGAGLTVLRQDMRSRWSLAAPCTDLQA